MISLRTALCLSGLLVVATGSAALDATPPSEDAVTRTQLATSSLSDQGGERLLHRNQPATARRDDVPAAALSASASASEGAEDALDEAR